MLHFTCFNNSWIMNDRFIHTVLVKIDHFMYVNSPIIQYTFSSWLQQQKLWQDMYFCVFWLIADLISTAILVSRKTRYAKLELIWNVNLRNWKICTNLLYTISTQTNLSSSHIRINRLYIIILSFLIFYFILPRSSMSSAYSSIH